MKQFFSEIRSTLEHLETLDSQGQFDYLAGLELEGAGSIKIPDVGNTWDTQNFEISIYGVSANGSTQRDAILEWSKAAGRHADNLEQFEIAEATLWGERGQVTNETMIAACDTLITSIRLRGTETSQRVMYETAKQVRHTLKKLTQDPVAA